MQSTMHSSTGSAESVGTGDVPESWQSHEPFEGVTGPTARFRRQHLELFTEALEIGAQLSPENVAQSPQHLRRAIARFAGRLRVHAQMEDGALYPRLLASTNPEIRALAQSFVADVGPIYASFDAFELRWPTAESIAQAPADFARDTARILKVLGRRMMLENDVLYPAVDAADDAEA